jgi:hypothetical protein
MDVKKESNMPEKQLKTNKNRTKQNKIVIKKWVA